MATITIYDETTTGEKFPGLTLSLPKLRLTARELIRQRVNQEVAIYNSNESEWFQGLVQPTDSERSLNGYKLRKARQIDPEQQFEKAISAFQSNGFILLVGDRQVEDLDTELELDESAQVSFLKLVPLVGG
ncbi:MAG: hypothetical protein KME27_13045 [Lyngbya sp. HA4199-MV5]|nr:hypothetical protein [Lyngbya sp. HA4199-MV5]